MSVFTHATIRNRLLAALSAEVFDRLAPRMKGVDLPVKHLLVEANKPTVEVCFLERGLASVVAASHDDEVAEVGHIGPEGMSGTHVLLGTDRTANKTFMQVSGFGIKIPVPSLLAVLDADPALRKFFLRYVHSSELQLAHSALANARYNMHERLARWLLMCHDRLEGNNLPLTHEFLALMLGVRRSGVTNELHIIEGLGAIKSTRGNVRIIDRARLEEIAAGCYGIPEDEYERLVGLPIRRDTDLHVVRHG